MMTGVRQSMKRMLPLILSAGLAAATVSEAVAEPHILIDMKTGRVIEHEAAFQKWYPASLTKLMTAYVAFRQIEAGRVSLSTPIVMSKRSSSQPASKMYLKPGDSMTLDDALKILLVKSANDIAYAIAENLGGSMENYVVMMNAEAARLGMASTHYINPNGMPGDGQYTDARDLALLAYTLRKEFPQYFGYFSIEGIQVGKKQVPNYNKLIGRFDGADGMKTGFICASGYNQVSSATRNGHQGLAVNSNFGMTTLDRLKPYGETRDTVADISGQICGHKDNKKKVRSEGQDDAGPVKTVSPYLKPIGRPLALQVVTITPAPKPDKGAKNDGGAGQGDDVTANVPIPQPRPVN